MLSSYLPPPSLSLLSSLTDVSLIGLRSGGPLQGTQLFKEGKSTITFCLGEGGGRDNAVCESDTHGSITLINSSAIRLVEPYMTRITITDDECEWVFMCVCLEYIGFVI